MKTLYFFWFLFSDVSVFRLNGWQVTSALEKQYGGMTGATHNDWFDGQCRAPDALQIKAGMGCACSAKIQQSASASLIGPLQDAADLWPNGRI